MIICLFCLAKGHRIYFCNNFRGISVPERRDFIRSNQLFYCLGKGQGIKECKNTKSCFTLWFTRMIRHRVTPIHLLSQNLLLYLVTPMESESSTSTNESNVNNVTAQLASNEERVYYSKLLWLQWILLMVGKRSQGH